MTPYSLDEHQPRGVMARACLFVFSTLALLLLALFTLALPPAYSQGSSPAQTEDTLPAMTTRVLAQIDPGALALYDTPPMPEDTEIWSDFGEERWVRNVTRPTVLPILPDPDTANGAAILLIPGGGFQFVSIDNEGYRIAEPLVAQGYTVFLLKYRTMTTPQDEAGFSNHMRAIFSGREPFSGFDRTRGMGLAVQDAVLAWQIIHEGAADWDIDITRTGVLGFSAGAITALGLSLDTADTAIPVPAFLGYVYGPMNPPEIPAIPPPLFVALAADDSLFAGQGFALIEEWQARGSPVEFHYYESGGHGFGSYQRGTPADDWLNQFTTWLDTRGVSAE